MSAKTPKQELDESLASMKDNQVFSPGPDVYVSSLLLELQDPECVTRAPSSGSQLPVPFEPCLSPLHPTRTHLQ